VVVQPRLVDLLALGLDLHARTIIRDARHSTDPAERKEKRADAHHLDPVVLIGGDGLTPPSSRSSTPR
jgi:hypothetical protein